MSTSAGLRIACGGLVSPWMLGLVGSFLVAMSMLHDVADVVRRAADVSRRAEAARAHLVAEAAALAAFDAPEAAVASTIAGDGVVVSRQAGSVVVVTRAANGTTRRFEARELPGAPPVALGRPLSFVEPLDVAIGGVRLDPTAVPRLDPRMLAGADRAEAMPWLRRDHGIALLHWQAGTDRDDFVFQHAAKPVVLDAVGEILVVHGHLWVEPGVRPLELHLARDLTVVVQGNLYLGRSVRVHGSGRLLVVTAACPAGASFVDADGNGRWSEGESLHASPRFAGPIEGAGNVYCGLRGVDAGLEFAGGLVVGGQLHVSADTTVAGPLVLAHGMTAIGPHGRLHAAGEWRFHAERDLVPGFVTHGRPRPGMLRQCTTRPRVAADRMEKQPLYLSSPLR